MKRRKIGDTEVAEIGFGCMNLSHAYGHPPTPEKGREVLARALDLGVNHFDTAALYGFGKNEELVGPALKPVREKIFLASKCGMQGVNGKREIDGRPETIRATLEDSLRRLETEMIDLYYLHRWDSSVPIEDSVGEMSRFVEEGKVRMIGLSEVSADTLKKAHATFPVSALQTEYSLWTRNPEIAVLEACEELRIAFVAFSPVARGFLADGLRDLRDLLEKDIRTNMPRFQEPHFTRNLTLAETLRELAGEAGCTPAQFSLAWLLQKSPCIHPIPGTTSIAHLEENVEAADVTLPPALIEQAEAAINERTVSGPRYSPATQAEIDTEEFAA